MAALPLSLRAPQTWCSPATGRAARWRCVCKRAQPVSAAVSSHRAAVPASWHGKPIRPCVLLFPTGPWTASCIGHRNYRYFLLLLLYGTAALTHSLGLLLAHGLYLTAASQPVVLTQ